MSEAEFISVELLIFFSEENSFLQSLLNSSSSASILFWTPLNSFSGTEINLWSFISFFSSGAEVLLLERQKIYLRSGNPSVGAFEILP